MALLTALAIGSAVAGLGKAIYNHWQYQDTKAYNSAEAEKNRQFQATQANIDRNRADTSYQRSMADMQAAGLNPAMMFGGGSAEAISGSGASGSAASTTTNPIEMQLGMMNGISNVINSAANVLATGTKMHKAKLSAEKIISSAEKLLTK